MQLVLSLNILGLYRLPKGWFLLVVYEAIDADVVYSKYENIEDFFKSIFKNSNLGSSKEQYNLHLSAQRNIFLILGTLSLKILPFVNNLVASKSLCIYLQVKLCQLRNTP